MFAEVKNGAVVTFPYDYDVLVRKNPHTNFAQTDLLSMYSGTEDNVNGNELIRITVIDPPSYSKQAQKIIQNASLSFVNNAWELGWSIQELTQDEQNAQTALQAKIVRDQRDAKLKESDWTQVADAPVDKTAWSTYRQQLRDISTQSGFPWSVAFPTAPSYN